MPGIIPSLSKKESIVATIAESADVSPDARIGDDTKIWHLAQVREGADIGDRCIVACALARACTSVMTARSRITR